MRRAMLPGSFDPPTMGHVNIIERTAKLFDELYVVVANNIKKNYLFSEYERVEMLRECLKHLKNVKVVSYSGLMAFFAKENNIDVMVRGVRAQADFNYEFELAQNNMNLNPDVDTLFIPTDQKYFLLHSSQIKEFASFGVDITGMVPENVKKKMDERFISSSNAKR